MAVVAVVFEEDAQICRASSVPVLVEPGHLDRLQDALVRRLRVVREAGQLRHLVVQVGEPHGGISTTTSPPTTAWQPSREWSVSPSAVSSRSSSSSSIFERFSAADRTITWQVVQAHLPPQMCSGTMLFPSAMSKIEPGRPSSCSGNLAGSTSTVMFKGRNVTLYVVTTWTP